MPDIKHTYRKHYTLTEAAVNLDLTEIDLLHAAEDGLIALCYRARSPKTVDICYEYLSNDGDIDDETLEPRITHRIEEYQRQVEIGDYISLPDKAITKLSMRLPVLETDYPVELRIDESAHNVNQLDQVITIEDLVILPSELERVKSKLEHGKVLPKTASDDTKLAQAQKALSALAYGLSASDRKYQNVNKPNVSQIVSMALTGLQDSNGKSFHGMARTTLTNAINDAIKAYAHDIEENKGS